MSSIAFNSKYFLIHLMISFLTHDYLDAFGLICKYLRFSQNLSVIISSSITLCSEKSFFLMPISFSLTINVLMLYPFLIKKKKQLFFDPTLSYLLLSNFHFSLCLLLFLLLSSEPSNVFWFPPAFPHLGLWTPIGSINLCSLLRIYSFFVVV